MPANRRDKRKTRAQLHGELASHRKTIKGMKSKIGCLVVTMFVIFCGVHYCVNQNGTPDAFFQQPEETSWTVNTLPIQTSFIDSTDFNGVCNPDTLLSEEEVAILNHNIWALRNLDVQMLVIMVNRFSEPSDSHDFCMEVGRKYGIGTRGKNLGIVMLLGMETHDWSIVTGRGMEQYLTDLECNMVAEEIMVPELREGNNGLALIKGVEAIRRICEGEITADEAVANNIVGFSSAGGSSGSSQAGDDSELEGWDYVYIFAFVMIFVLVGYLAKRNGGDDDGGGGGYGGSSGGYYSSGGYSSSSSSYGGGSFGGGGASGKW